MKALANPQILAWAREDAGYSIEEAAQKIKIKPDRLKGWEFGTDNPTIKQLRKLGKLYKRPLAVFYLSTPPKMFQALKDFRRLPKSYSHKESPALRFEIRQANYRRDVALDLYEELGEKPPQLNLEVKARSNPEDLAVSLRKQLGISIQEQAGWRDGYGYKALNNWRSALENSGILVFQITEVDLNEVRGFSILEKELPVIAINIKDTPNGRIFTMLHEFTHLVIKSGGMCNLVEGQAQKYKKKDIEVFCNHVAGAIVVPLENLLSENAVKVTTEENWSEEELKNLASKYSVSKEVILRRLLIAEKISEQYYRRKHEEYEQEYQDIKKKPKKKGFALPHQMAISKAGPMFSNLVLESYYQETITSLDLSNYFGVKIKHLPKIEESVTGFSSKLGGAYAV